MRVQVLVFEDYSVYLRTEDMSTFDQDYAIEIPDELCKVFLETQARLIEIEKRIKELAGIDYIY